MAETFCDDARAGRARGFARTVPNCGAPEGRAKSRFRPETPAKPSAGLLFLMAGHTCLTHWPMPSSSRSTALRWALRLHSWSATGGRRDRRVANAKRALNVLGDTGQVHRSVGNPATRAPLSRAFQPLALAEVSLRGCRWRAPPRALCRRNADRASIVVRYRSTSTARPLRPE